MVEEKVMIPNKLGLHTRAAAKLVSIASQFESKIQLQHHQSVADCKSIMALILLGLTQHTYVTLLITGPDELEAREAIIALLNNRFGEAE